MEAVQNPGLGGGPAGGSAEEEEEEGEHRKEHLCPWYGDGSAAAQIRNQVQHACDGLEVHLRTGSSVENTQIYQGQHSWTLGGGRGEIRERNRLVTTS